MNSTAQSGGVRINPPFSSKSAGVYLWQFCDIRVSDEWWGVRPRTMNNKGVFDEYRRPKLCAEVVKKIFRET